MEEKKKEHELPKPGTSTGRSSQPDITKFLTCQKVTLSINANIFKNSIIELIVKDSMPLSMFGKPAMRNLLEEMAKKFKVNLDKDNIRDLVIDKYKEEKLALQEQLKGRFVHLKVDGCTRIRTHYFAINVRYVDDDNKIFTRTIAVKDTHAQHTSDYLHDLILKTLQDYGIQKEFVLCIVSDNATNMIKTVEKLNETTSSDDVTQVFTEYGDSRDYQNDEENDVLLDNLPEISFFSTIYHMRCGAHTLQLAINDGLKGRHASSLISKLRQLVVATRKPKVEEIIKRRAGKVSILDQPTRWGSTYLMIQRLLELKPVLLDMADPDLNITESIWAQARRLEKLLFQPYIVTKNMQSENLTPGQFLKEWKSLVFYLSKIEGTIADDIRGSMERRERILLDNDLLLAGIYIDPKYRCLLTSEQINKAKNAISNIVIRTQKVLNPSDSFQTSEKSDIVSAELSSSSSSPSTTCEDEESTFDFEKILDIQHGKTSKRIRLENESNLSTFLSQQSTLKLQVEKSFDIIEKYDRSSKLSFNQAVQSYPKVIEDVAHLLVAMPSTQVSVERLFSALKILKSDLRARMKEDIIEAMLFLRTNIYK